MSAPSRDDIWRIRIDDEIRRVKVIGAAGITGWWRCVDLATDIFVLARASCFVECERKARGRRRMPCVAGVDGRRRTQMPVPILASASTAFFRRPIN